MNKSQLLLITLLLIVVGVLWSLMFKFSMVTAHSRDALGTPAAAIE